MRSRSLLNVLAVPVVAMTFGSIWPCPVFSQTFEQLIAACSGTNATPDEQIAGCTGLIRSGRGTPKGLAEAHYNRGNAYRNKHDAAHAIADYDEAIRYNPAMAVAFGNRGGAYQEEGQYERAVADYDEAIRLNPAGAVPLRNRCWTRAILGQLPQALDDCNESLRVRPADAVTLVARGFVYLKSGALAEAIADYDAVLRTNPNAAVPLYGRGVARQRQGDAGGAADIAAARTVNAAIADQFARFGVQ
ncbi:MAG TPA: tetratricopeptide repeat protein [Xanthobacteraceae bacterium]|nr:tetratricopeptide repeat protein [Xanthobacteraceae bacterium]